MQDLINKLDNKDDVEAYQTLLSLENLATENEEIYNYFDTFLHMINSDRSYVKVRGFRLICSLAKYDKLNKINDNINEILKVFDDNQGTTIRQCLSKINLMLLYKYELTNIIEEKLNKLDYSKYKETMQSLIKRDIEKLSL